MRHHNLLCWIVALLPVSSVVALISAQSARPPAEEALQPTNSYTLRVNTREVVVDVIAMDAHDQPVRNLSPTDLTVLDQPENAAPAPVIISNLRIIDPGSFTGAPDAAQAGFHLGRMETCLERASVHYELVYHPGDQAEKSGFHKVVIQTSRRGVRLFYRHRYYVGRTPRPSEPSTDEHHWEKELYEDACSHLVVPASIGLRAVRVETGAIDTVRYSIDIDADAVAFISFSEGGRRVQLDYGACNFNLEVRLRTVHNAEEIGNLFRAAGLSLVPTELY